MRFLKKDKRPASVDLLVGIVEDTLAKVEAKEAQEAEREAEFYANVNN